MQTIHFQRILFPVNLSIFCKWLFFATTLCIVYVNRAKEKEERKREKIRNQSISYGLCLPDSHGDGYQTLEIITIESNQNFLIIIMMMIIHGHWSHLFGWWKKTIRSNGSIWFSCFIVSSLSNDIFFSLILILIIFIIISYWSISNCIRRYS